MPGRSILTLLLLALLAGCVQGALPPAGSGGVSMQPYTSQEYAFHGLAPAGWTESSPGLFVRGPWPQDPTLFLEQAQPGVTLEWFTVQSVLAPLGLRELPAAIGTRRSAALDWQLYAFETRMPEAGDVAVELALAADDRGVYVVTLVAPRGQSAALRQAVFLPAVEALAPFSRASRDLATAQSLWAPYYPDRGPIHNSYFAPLGQAGPALHALEGTLTVPEFYMQSHYLPADVSTRRLFFPGFSAHFFTYGDSLVPIEREILPAQGPQSDYRAILSPGRVWSEPGDNGMSRAALPLVLVMPTTSDTYNGLATFLYDGTGVSSFRFQVVQETGQLADLWGQSPMDYIPGPLPDHERLAGEFARELADQLPVRPWLDLLGEADPYLLYRYDGPVPLPSISAAGLIRGDTLYMQPCCTRYGAYPYCQSMRHGSFSTAKSLGAALAMLRLAQQYGEGVFDLHIADYVTVTAAHDGWAEVTFGDALNMATGVGSHLPERVEPNAIIGNDDGPAFESFMAARSAQEKLDLCFARPDYPWGPGEVARYSSCDTFILSVALDRYYRSMAGPGADVWDMVTEEVLKPIGVHHAPILRTLESDGARGIPLFWVGLYPTVDDLAKVAMLLRDGGQHEGQQLLHPGKVAEALRQGAFPGFPSGEMNAAGEGTYLMSFWSMPYRTADGRTLQVPYMSGFGGNRVVFNPNGIITFRLTDAQDYDSLPLMRLAESLAPFVSPSKEVRE